jgi:curved DNA-binding protein CbpA
LGAHNEIFLTGTRQIQRIQEGISLTSNPQHRASFHELNRNDQFKENQRYEKQLFEHQNDEQTMKSMPMKQEVILKIT